MSQTQKIALVKQMLLSAEKSVKAATKILEEMSSGKIKETPQDKEKLAEKATDLNVLEEGKVIEGVFDGLNMIGPDKRQYPIPSNYASKSKLVEGDILKLTIADDGTFIFKQIGPVERTKVIGTLVKEDADFKVVIDDTSYKVLLASVTYFKAEEGDEVTIIVPQDKKSTWAAIENVIKKGTDEIENFASDK